MKPPPTFDSKFLRELAGTMRFKAGERLFESHQVRASRWESPVLKGEVSDAGESFFPELNLRSTVFADNRCTCSEGRKRKVCAHAVAAALHFEAAQQEAAAAKLETEPEAAAEPSPGARRRAGAAPAFARSLRGRHTSAPPRLFAAQSGAGGAAAGDRREARCGGRTSDSSP